MVHPVFPLFSLTALLVFVLIPAKHADVLQFVGHRISPEMQVPKLMWLQQHAPATWKRAAHFLDLADYLTFAATGGCAVRSACTTVCKWTYVPKHAQKHCSSGAGGSGGAAKFVAGGWHAPFFEAVGLGALVGPAEGGCRIGTATAALGEALGDGLSAAAAAQLGPGLRAGIAVSAGIIDAHAGGVGMLGAAADGKAGTPKLLETLCLIGGTSTCHMALSSAAHVVPGVWGPFWNAMVPGAWLTEGGQSATGVQHLGV